MKNKIICIVGATASGKTRLGVELAKKINAEIISADSMQIYKGLDIGTAKVSKDEMEGIPHHLINICDIKDRFSVADFKNMCYDRIEKILNQGKNVVIVGGTGLYINSVVYDMNFGNENEDLKQNLTKEYESLNEEILFEKLKQIDPMSAKDIHPNNKKRIIRALSFANISDKLKSTHIQDESERLKGFSHPKYEFFVYVIDYPREELYKKINKRVDIMVQSGILQEAKMIYDMNLDKNLTCMQAIGYKEFFDYFKGEISLDEAINNLKKATRHYAKRQITWFKNKTKCDLLKDYNDVNLMVDYIIKNSKIV